MIYHALPPGRAKHWAHRCDHAAIFVFIAGSYTPFALGPLHDIDRPAAADGGLVARRARRGVQGVGPAAPPLDVDPAVRDDGLDGLVLLDPLAARIGPDAVTLLLAGGVAYTVGALFFMFDHRLRYGHFVWHLFVLGGSGCHVVAALGPGL